MLDLLVLEKMQGIRMLVVLLLMVLLVMVLLPVDKLLDQLLDQPHQLIDMLLGMHLVMLMLLDKRHILGGQAVLAHRILRGSPIEI